MLWREKRKANSLKKGQPGEVGEKNRRTKEMFQPLKGCIGYADAARAG